MPDGNVIVTGGSRDNNGNGGYVTNAEIWNPDDRRRGPRSRCPTSTPASTTRPRCSCPTAAIMIGGGGAPGPRNYTDVEYYSPAYLFDGDEPADAARDHRRPEEDRLRRHLRVATSDSPVSRVTLVRNGSVTHGFNNDQNFQDLAFTQAGGTVTITAPAGRHLRPSRAPTCCSSWTRTAPRRSPTIVQIDPAGDDGLAGPRRSSTSSSTRACPADWRGGNPPASRRRGRRATAGCPRGTVDSQVQLVRGTAAEPGWPRPHRLPPRAGRRRAA